MTLLVIQTRQMTSAPECGTGRGILDSSAAVPKTAIRVSNTTLPIVRSLLMLEWNGDRRCSGSTQSDSERLRRSSSAPRASAASAVKEFRSDANCKSSSSLRLEYSVEKSFSILGSDLTRDHIVVEELTVAIRRLRSLSLKALCGFPCNSESPVPRLLLCGKRSAQLCVKKAAITYL